MIKPDMIPDEVVDHVWKRCECVRRFDAREAIAAAINAWPGMSIESLNPFGETKHVVLPLEDK